MNNMSFNYAAIDTNVFEQLFNPCENSSNHIDKLLERLMLCHNTRLIMDCGNRIKDEYGHRLGNHIAKTDDTVLNRKQILKYFFKHNKRVRVCVDQNDVLMKNIKSIVRSGQGVDAIFVYVAFKKGKILITNDRKDIIDNRKGDEHRRKKLLKIHNLPKSAGILTSMEAVKIC